MRVRQMRFLATILIALGSTASAADDTIRHYFETLTSGYSLPVHGDYLISTDELQTFYKERKYQPVWYRNGKISSAATELYLAVETATVDGLEPEDYHNRALQETCATATGVAIAYCDLLFTDAFFLLAQHLSAGKVDPEKLSPDWPADLQRPLIPLLQTALAEGKVKQTLAGMRPTQLKYERLMAVLRRLRVAEAPDWPALPVTPAITPGQEDERMGAIVERLVFWGDMQSPTDPITFYSEEVQQAVEYFQGRHGLRADGSISEATLNALNVSPAARARQIQTNMERLRWLADDLGAHHLLVNIAGFELQAVKHGETVFTTPVAVSPYCSQVPVFSSSIRYLVFNPTWTVPRDAVAHQLSAIQRDPDYLDRLGFTVYADMTPIAVNTVNWSQLSEHSFVYRLVQAPGPHNAMGQVKFMFPNNYNVSLHDAPGEDLFDETEMAFDAGCIRVQQPLDLAAWTLKDANWSRQQLHALLEEQVPRALYLRDPLPVHVEYRTAWVDSKGVLNFRADVYQRDQTLHEALTRPMAIAP